MKTKREMMQQIKMLQRELENALIRADNAENYTIAALEIAAEHGVKISSDLLTQRIRNNTQQ